MAALTMARAPVRNADLGGWRDTRLFPSGKVLNIAIRMYTHVSLMATDREGVHIESHDIGESEYIQNLRDLEYKGALGLLKAAVGKSGVNHGLKLIVHSEAPPASGLGSSAALSVAALAALYASQGKHFLPHHIARDAQRLETEYLKLECGVQDQIAAAFGGINYIEVNYPDARVTAVPISDDLLCELEARMLVIYTGKSHFSSGTHKNVIANFEAGKPETLRAFEGLDTTADMGLAALLEEDLDRYAEALNVNWEFQKALHESITTPGIDEMESRVRQEGCEGFKLNGAGAGGTAMLVCAPNSTRSVVRVIEDEFPEMQVYRPKVDIGRCQGLQVWSSHSS